VNYTDIKCQQGLVAGVSYMQPVCRMWPMRVFCAACNVCGNFQRINISICSVHSVLFKKALTNKQYTQLQKICLQLEILYFLQENKSKLFPERFRYHHSCVSIILQPSHCFISAHLVLEQFNFETPALWNVFYWEKTGCKHAVARYSNDWATQLP